MDWREENKLKQKAQEYYEKEFSYNQVYIQGYSDGYNKAIDEFAEVLKEICKNHPISNDGHTPLYIHEDGTYHELIEDAVKQMKGE